MNFTKQNNVFPNIGKMDTKVKFLTPVRNTTSLAGETITYLDWKEVFAYVAPMNAGTHESTEAARLTAFNTQQVICRALSIPGVNETMVIQINGDNYDIQTQQELQIPPRNHYLNFSAIRRDGAINTVLFDDSQLGIMYLDFAESTANKSGLTHTVTQGTLLDPDDFTAQEMHLLLNVYRGGKDGMVRVHYGDGFTISGNVLTFGQQLRFENLLIQQYNKVSN